MQLETQLSTPRLTPPGLGAVDRYQLLRVLGQGGMGIVYAAWDPSRRCEVALKVLHPRVAADDAEAQARLIREGRAMARLAHDNVVAAHDVGIADGRVYVAMQLVRGTTLRAWADDQRGSVRERLRVLIEAGRGLAAAHAAGIVHRDFKPDNVLIDEGGVARVTDFGIARITEQPTDPAYASTNLTRTGAVIGTPAYMSPEQAEGLPAGVAADQFSFCVTAYELLAGQRPFAGTSPAVVMANILTGSITAAPAESAWPRGLRRALRRGLSVAPSDRFATMSALLAAIERAVRPRRAGRVAVLASAFSIGAIAATLGLAPVAAVADPPGLVLAGAEHVALRTHASAAEVAPSHRHTPDRGIPEVHRTARLEPGPRAAASRERRAEPASSLDDAAEVTRLGRIELGLVDGIRRQRGLRVADITGYSDLVAAARGAIERGDGVGAASGMRAMRVAIDGVHIDGAFVAAKHARLAAKVASAKGSDADLGELARHLADAEQLAGAGRFGAANAALEQVARRLASEVGPA